MFGRLQHWFGNGWMGIADLLMSVLCVFLSLSIHEFAHGYAAYKLGDNTAKYMGRLNLKPTSHLDPIGAVCLFLFGFGWAKPVPVNANNFKPGKRKSGMVITSIAGPAGNLILAFISMLLIRIIALGYGLLLNATGGAEIIQLPLSLFVTMLNILISMNISLAVFNLIPIPPLDGSKILNSVLPARIYFKIMQYEQYGFIILILLLNLPVFDRLLYFLVNGVYGAFNWVLNLIPFL